jgi:hypothetical protein
MSLDKFVMRGFTSSVGSSQGKWVSSGPQTQAPPAYQANHEQGSSFIMGGGALSRPPCRDSKETGKHIPKLVDDRYSYNANDVMRGGTSNCGGIPSNCIGGGNTSSGTIDSQKAVPFVFYAIAVILCAMVAMASSGPSKQQRDKSKTPAYGEGTSRPNRGQPVWYR